MIHEQVKDPPKQKDPPIIQIGLRRPKDFFITSGVGESSEDIHTCSYQAALLNAGIAGGNVMKYSSMLPEIATKVEKPSEESLEELLKHGSVLDVIEASSTVGKDERATAGIIYGWLYDRETNKKYGGVVCERTGINVDEKEIEERLRASINELYEKGYSKRFKLKDVIVTTKSFVSKEKYGTAGVWICFLNFEVPYLGFENKH